MVRYSRTLSAILLVVLVGACAQPPVPQDRYYRLQLESPSAGAVVLDGVVEIDRLGAGGLTAGRAIIYTDEASPGLAQEFFYDFWVEPPGDMLRDALIDHLRAAGVAGAIVTPEARAEATYNIYGRIDRLELVRGPSPKGVVDLEFSVTHARSGKLVMVNSYAVGVDAADGGVSAGVAAVNQGVAAVFERFVADLRAAR